MNKRPIAWTRARKLADRLTCLLAPALIKCEARYQISAQEMAETERQLAQARKDFLRDAESRADETKPKGNANR